MNDIVTPETRSRMMSGIRGKNTKPELIVRKGLHARGYRFRLHRKDLPGSPDLVLPKYAAVILINGCFWHGHQCRLFKWPKTRPEFWSEKILDNIRRDKKNISELRKLNWRVSVLWECEIKSAREDQLRSIIDALVEWLQSDSEEIHFPHSLTQSTDSGN